MTLASVGVLSGNGGMPTLRHRLIRLAHSEPTLRPHLLPVLARTAASSATAGDTWGLQLDLAKAAFIKEVLSESESIFDDAGAKKVTYGTNTVIGMLGDVHFQVMWSWERGNSMIKSRMVLGSNKREGQHMVLSMSPMNVAAESIYKHFQGLIEAGPLKVTDEDRQPAR